MVSALFCKELRYSYSLKSIHVCNNDPGTPRYAANDCTFMEGLHKKLSLAEMLRSLYLFSAKSEACIFRVMDGNLTYMITFR